VSGASYDPDYDDNYVDGRNYWMIAQEVTGDLKLEKNDG